MNQPANHPAAPAALPYDGGPGRQLPGERPTLWQAPVWRPPLWLKLLLGLGLSYVLGRALLQFYTLAPQSGTLLGKLSLKWGLGFAGLGLAALAVLVLAWVALLQPQRLAGPAARLIPGRQALRGGRWPAALILAALPANLLIFSGLGDLLDGGYVRLVLLLAFAGLVALLITDDEQRLVCPADFLLALVLVAGLHITAERLSNVSAYPFSLTWSEGNRLYDYSTIADPGRYILADTAGFRTEAWGRLILWGMLFLVPNSPIWLHRLWDAFLWTVPYVGLGYLLARRAGLSGRGKWLFTLWVFVFLFQGPIYTPLVLSAVLVVAFVRAGRWLASLLAVSAGGYYAAASRWTWLPACAAWAGILWLDELELAPLKRSPAAETAAATGAPAQQPSTVASWRQTLLQLVFVGLVAAAGLAGAALANDRLFSPQKLKSSTALAQPLLWYRMLPNVNFPEGILFGLLLATLPVVALLMWLAFTRRWRLNWAQALGYAGAGLVFLGAGIVASAKIGGGNNLHNLDMFLITLVLLAALAIRRQTQPAAAAWPAWVPAALLLACLLPAWSAVKLGGPLHLPAVAETQDALQTLQKRVTKVQKRGPVLFIDQRQLLTFGYIEGVTLIPDYEKKFLMDKAMAGDQDYFARFYRDLADKRFAMIVTEPLFDNLQDMTSGFQEENNAWVQWVAQPLLCYYAPVETLPGARTQLLVPRDTPQGCP